MRVTTRFALPLVFVLAACGGADESSTGASGEKTVAAATVAERAQEIRPEPGLYRSTVEVLEVEIPGAPAQLKQMMRDSMSSQTSEYCLTQEEVDEGFERMAKRSQDGECDFERFDATGGKIDAVMTCKSDGGGTMRMTMNGVGTPTSSDMTMTMDGEMPGAGSMRIKAKARHERVGACPA